MSYALDLLNKTRQMGVTINAKADKLQISAPMGVVTPILKNELAANKAQLLRLLSSDHQPRRPSVYELVVDGKTFTVIDGLSNSLEAFTKSVKSRFGSDRVKSIIKKE